MTYGFNKPLFRKTWPNPSYKTAHQSTAFPNPMLVFDCNTVHTFSNQYNSILRTTMMTGQLEVYNTLFEMLYYKFVFFEFR